MSKKFSTTVIIPTYNEVDGIKKILPQLNTDWANDWFLIDGGSTDGTIETAKKLGFNVIIQKGLGLGAAYREAVDMATTDYVLFFHPDGNCIPEYIPKLINHAYEGNFDLVQISRFGKNGKSLDDTFVTSFGNRMFSFLVNCFFCGKLTDALYGYKIIKKNVFLNLHLDGEFQSAEQQVSIRMIKLGLKIAELDGTEPKRLGGEAKMKPLSTGYLLSKQIIKEYMFWKF